MRPFIATLFPPPDPVVAVHDSTEETDAAVDFLGRAGYPSRMLKVVASHACDRQAGQTSKHRPARDLTASGMFWGVLWAAIAMAGAALIAGNAVPPGAILMAGALVLAIQTLVVRSSLAPERVTRATWQQPGQSQVSYASELAANKILLLVSGSRSDIALARSLLRVREVAASDA